MMNKAEQYFIRDNRCHIYNINNLQRGKYNVHYLRKNFNEYKYIGL